MTLQQIKYILGVAEAGSFNRASEKLFISQPSLTSSVHDAERELGFEVFNRTSRGVNATERGKDFICDAREVYSHYEDLIKKYSQSGKKTFSVSTLYYAFARTAFVQIVKEFSKGDLQGTYDFAFREKKASGVIEDVALGKSELGILYLSDSNRNFILKNLNANNLEFHHLTECSAFVYLHKNHPLAKKESLCLEDLSDYHFVTFDTDDVNSFFSEQVNKQFNLDKAITVADRSTELNLLQTLNGYTFLSGVFGEEGNENSEDFILIPLQNHDKKISHIFELGYITKKVTRLDNISLTYLDTIRRILHIAGFTC